MLKNLDSQPVYLEIRCRLGCGRKRVWVTVGADLLFRLRCFLRYSILASYGENKTTDGAGFPV